MRCRKCNKEFTPYDGGDLCQLCAIENTSAKTCKNCGGHLHNEKKDICENCKRLKETRIKKIFRNTLSVLVVAGGVIASIMMKKRVG